MPAPTIILNRGTGTVMQLPDGKIASDSDACGVNLEEVSTITISYRLQGTSPGTSGHPCSATIDKTISAVWNRIDRDFDAPTEPSGTDFQLYKQCCGYFLRGGPFTLNDSIAGSGICNRPTSGGFSDSVADASEITAEIFFSSDTVRGELDFLLNCVMRSGGVTQPGSACGDSAAGITTDILPIDLSDFLGTYILEETHTEPTYGSSYTLTVTVAVA